MATETTTETVAAAGYNTFPASIPPFPSIPTCPVNTISLANLRKSPAESEKFFQACKDLGFFYLDLRGDPEGEVMLKEASDLFEFSPKLFDLGKEELMKYWVELQVSLDGYKLFESKTKDENKEATYLEVYNYPKNDAFGISKNPLKHPQLLHDNGEFLKSYMLHCHSMAETIMSYLDIHLHLPPGTLEALHQHHVPAPEQLRFTKSPPQPHIDVPIKGHADLGSVTILFNQLGGLQILTPPYLTNGTEPEWLYVKPLPGHCIVNLGDALVKFSNGLLRSNMHRVVPPPGEQAELTRYSLVYFSRPDDNCVWKPLESDIIPKVKHREYDDVAESGASSTQLLLKKKEEVERMQKVSRHVIDSGQTGKHLKD